MPVIELKKYDDKYLMGIILCLKRNYNRFGCMMDLDVYKFILERGSNIIPPKAITSILKL